MIIMRTREIKLSDEEHRLLTEFKKEYYETHTPFGFIIGDLIEGELKND